MRQTPLLLTPGPLTTSPAVKQPMSKDYGSRDPYFVDIVRDVRRELLGIANATEGYTTVLVQGSGTYAVESCITSLIGKNDRLLILINGAYGKRIQSICAQSSIPFTVVEKPENEVITPGDVRDALKKDPSIGHVAVVYCETTTGLINPVEDIADVVNSHGKKLLIDAMSSFGAFPADAKKLKYTAVMASSNKCLHGVPGIGYVIVKTDAIQKSKGVCPSLSLDLHAQWIGLEKNNQFRFTPPVQVLASFREALREFMNAGGIRARHQKYIDNSRVVIAGLKKLGFGLYLDEAIQGPIILTFLSPKHDQYDFDVFYKKLSDRGFAIYPGKLTDADTFRIGCIGHIDTADMDRFIVAVGQVKAEMGF